MSREYVHGYSQDEQQRLVDQAKQLERYIYMDVDFSDVTELLEVGCGVGAQTEILLRRYPHLKITSVDISEIQIKTAKERLQDFVNEGRVKFVQADASKLEELGKKDFDAAFVCWFLEHVPSPKDILSAVRRCLKPEAQICITEVDNSSFFVDPYSPNILKYWFEMNDYQWTIKGHPFIGLQLGNYLLESGYHDINTDLRNFFFDSRHPQQRNAFFKQFLKLIMSASDNLIKDGRITEDLIVEMDKEIERAFASNNSVIMYGWVRAVAKA